MKFFKFIFLIFSFLIFSACEDLSFSDEDSPLPKVKRESRVGTEGLSPVNEPEANKPSVNEIVIIETTDNVLKEKEIPENEITTIAEDFELTEDTVIKNTRVVLHLATIKTGEHDLVIVADEFLSNHSVIQNFPSKQKAKDQTPGRNGGNILIEAETARGMLKLILNGEDAGPVPAKRSISIEERIKLFGRRGRDGKDAIYHEICKGTPVHIRNFSTEMGFPSVNRILSAGEKGGCRKKCGVPPTEGQPSSDGQRGLPGFDGLKGGDFRFFPFKGNLLIRFSIWIVPEKWTVSRQKISN